MNDSKTTAPETLTDDMIRALRAEAAAAGDGPMVATCDRALGIEIEDSPFTTEREARAICAKAIADASAQDDADTTRTDDAWRRWHDEAAHRHSQTIGEAEARCAAWVAGDSDDGPTR